LCTVFHDIKHLGHVPKAVQGTRPLDVPLCGARDQVLSNSSGLGVGKRVRVVEEKSAPAASVVQIQAEMRDPFVCTTKQCS
jgi:hypothetical protein